MLTIKNTGYFSFIVQIVIGILQLKGIFIKLPSKYNILINILQLETFVQIVEAIFYYWLLNNFDKKNKITETRYFDWVLTTPTMLLSTIMYFKFLENENNSEKKISFIDFIKENKKVIIKIFIYNWLMLLLGYLGEKGLIPKEFYIPIGFIFLILSFKTIYDNFVVNNNKSKKLFYFIFTIWSLYGVAALLPFNEKNIMYNILDIISKNFYGIYIYNEVIKYNNISNN